MEKELAERIALFRFGVIAPLVDRSPATGTSKTSPLKFRSGIRASRGGAIAVEPPLR
jgi:hypothetical protein